MLNILRMKLSNLEKDGIDVKNRLFVSYGCPLILNYHILARSKLVKQLKKKVQEDWDNG